jgi:hypothetical protein
MKHFLLFVFCVVFFQSNINAQCYNIELNDIEWERQYSDLACHELKGPLSKVTSFSYKPLVNFGRITKGERVCHNEIFFNKNGEIQKIISFDETNKIDKLTTYEYEDGRKKFKTNYNSKGELINKTIFIKEGQILRKQMYIKDGSPNDEYFVYTYDARGYVIKKEYKYHASESSTNPTVKYFSYDNYNRIIEIFDGGRKDTIIYKDTYSKQPTKFSVFDRVEKKVTEGLIIEYNKKGDIIKETIDGKLMNYYEYTYDAKDNWITRIEFETEAKIPYSIVNRKIEYLK